MFNIKQVPLFLTKSIYFYWEIYIPWYLRNLWILKLVMYNIIRF